VKKKVFALMMALVLLLGFTAGCGQQQTKAEKSTANEKKVIRIGYQASSSLTILAKAKGFFEEEFGKDGTEVSYSLFVAGPPMVEALSGDRLDIANLGPLPAISARSSGIDVKAVGRAYSDDLYYGLLVRPDSSISSVKDLAGKKIGVQVGSGAHLFLMLLLQQNGLKNSDVNVVNLPTSDHQTALATGNVDAVATWQPFVSTIELSKAGKVLANSKNVIQTVGVYLARNGFGQKDPALVERFLKVHQKATDYLKNNPDEAFAIISKESKLPVEAVAKSVQTIDWGLQITEDDVKTLLQAKNYLKDTNVLKKDFDINELVDRKYLNNIGVK
jgi:sulfonate transport system substrate-binding protein